LCGNNAAGDMALLIANPSSAAASWRVEDSAAGAGVISLQEINPADSSVRRSTLSTLAAEIPGYSVQLVEMKASATPALRVFSAASFAEGEAAPASLVSLFGTGLSGASVLLHDAARRSHPATVIYSSSGQINLLVPAAASLGRATLAVRRTSGDTLEVSLNILPVAPGLFTANADGGGAPAARFLRLRPGGELAAEYAFRLDPATGRYVPAPLLVGEPGEEAYLELYGTGIRGRSGLGAVSAVAGATPCDVLAAQAHSLYEGLDQVNIKLPAALRGRGELTLRLVVDGRAATPVELSFRSCCYPVRTLPYPGR